MSDEEVFYGVFTVVSDHNYIALIINFLCKVENLSGAFQVKLHINKYKNLLNKNDWM